MATFGLILTIIGLARHRPTDSGQRRALHHSSLLVHFSSRFANRAITVVRSLTDSFASIAPENVPLFSIWCMQWEGNENGVRSELEL